MVLNHVMLLLGRGQGCEKKCAEDVLSIAAMLAVQALLAAAASQRMIGSHTTGRVQPGQNTTPARPE
jgi:hypothetical protein